MGVQDLKGTLGLKGGSVRGVDTHPGGAVLSGGEGSNLVDRMGRDENRGQEECFLEEGEERNGFHDGGHILQKYHREDSQAGDDLFPVSLLLEGFAEPAETACRPQIHASASLPVKGWTGRTLTWRNRFCSRKEETSCRRSSKYMRSAGRSRLMR